MSAARVLYVIDSLGLSGKSKAMVDLVAGLDPARYVASVAYFKHETSVLEGRLRSLGVDLREVPCPDGLNMQIFMRLGALLRQLRPTVIHCYNPRPMFYGGIAARLLGVRAGVGTLSAFACTTPEDDFTYLPQELMSSSWSNRLRTRAACGLLNNVVAVSPKLGQRFCRYNGVNPSRLRIIPYGVDLERFDRVTPEAIAAFRARHEVPAGAVVVGSVARLVDVKDYDTQLKAFARAAARVANAFMLVCGDGPLRGALEEQARALGVADRVRFTGHINDVPVALRALDIFVQASKFESYGVALLEAKAAGAAIVATRVNEIPEILGEGTLGRMVKVGDVEAMGNEIADLATDRSGREALGGRAAKEARTRHSLRGFIEAYEQLYDDVRGLTGGSVQVDMAS
jgi:glycosyltransferase involved in cell wall biosynthesis